MHVWATLLLEPGLALLSRDEARRIIRALGHERAKSAAQGDDALPWHRTHSAATDLRPRHIESRRLAPSFPS